MDDVVKVALLYPVKDPVPEVVVRLVVDIALGVSVAKTSFTENSKSCFSPDALTSYSVSSGSTISELTPFFINMEVPWLSDPVSETTVAMYLKYYLHF